MFFAKKRKTDETDALVKELIAEIRALREALEQQNGAKKEEGVTFGQIMDEWQNGKSNE